jgi:hypothetical protein
MSGGISLHPPHFVVRGREAQLLKYPSTELQVKPWPLYESRNTSSFIMSVVSAFSPKLDFARNGALGRCQQQQIEKSWGEVTGNAELSRRSTVIDRPAARAKA